MTLSAVASDVVDYDSDGDGLLEIRTLAQLNAVRWDLDGDGMVTDDANTAGIERGRQPTPPPSRRRSTANMGCPTGCDGCELMADLRLRRGRRRRRGLRTTAAPTPMATAS